MSVRLSASLSAWNSSAPTRRIFITFDTKGLFENLSRKFKPHYYLTIITSILRQRLCTFIVIFRWIFLKMKMFQTSCRNKTCSVRKRNIEARSCINFWTGKAISITYSGGMFIALVIQDAMHMRHIVICGLPGSTNFSHISHKWQDFRKKKRWIYNVRLDFLCKLYLKHFSFKE